MTRFPLPALVVAALVAVSPARASKPPDEESAAPAGPATCDLTGYKGDTQTFTPSFVIPDNHPANTLVGTITTAEDGSEFRDVALAVEIAHTWMGDLVLHLEYVSCDTGTPLFGSDILCRPRGTNLLPPAPCGTGTSAGCSGNLGSTSASTPPPDPVGYIFSDSASVALAEGTCPSVAPPGCYLPTRPGAFFGFRGLAKGGCWKLWVADWAERDVGVIASWTVFSNNVPIVATRETSWGRLKTIYR